MGLGCMNPGQCKCGCEVCETLFEKVWQAKLCGFVATDLTGDGMSAAEYTQNQAIAGYVMSDASNLVFDFDSANVYASGTYTLASVNWTYRVNRMLLGFAPDTFYAKEVGVGYRSISISNAYVYIGARWTDDRPCDFNIYWGLTFNNSLLYVNDAIGGSITGYEESYLGGSPQSNSFSASPKQIECAAPNEVTIIGRRFATQLFGPVGFEYVAENPFDEGATLTVNAADSAITMADCPSS